MSQQVEVKNKRDFITDCYTDISSIENTQREIISSYIDLSTLIEKQQPVIDIIEENIEKFVIDTGKCTQEVEKALKKQNSSATLLPATEKKKSKGMHRWWMIPAGIIGVTSVFMIVAGSLPLSVIAEAILISGGLLTICLIGGISYVVAECC